MCIRDRESTGIFKEIKRKVCRSWRYREAVVAYNYGPFYHVEVQENPSDRPNTHWVMHLSVHQAQWIEKKIVQVLEKKLGFSIPENAVHIEEVHKSGGMFKYLNKGINPAYAEHLHVIHKDQGTVYGQRTNTSRNLGRTARKNAKWKRKRKFKEIPRP